MVYSKDQTALYPRNNGIIRLLPFMCIVKSHATQVTAQNRLPDSRLIVWIQPLPLEKSIVLLLTVKRLFLWLWLRIGVVPRAISDFSSSVDCFPDRGFLCSFFLARWRKYWCRISAHARESRTMSNQLNDVSLSFCSNACNFNLLSIDRTRIGISSYQSLLLSFLNLSECSFSFSTATLPVFCSKRVASFRIQQPFSSFSWRDYSMDVNIIHSC